MTIPLSPTPVHPLPLAATFAVVALLLAPTLNEGRILHLRYARHAGNILQGKKSGNRADKDH